MRWAKLRRVSSGVGSVCAHKRRKAVQGACGATVQALEGRVLLSTVYVDASAAGSIHDGASWATAYTDLQPVLQAATPGTRIVVAAGTYKPTNGTDRTATFQLKSGVELDGGYAGDRNPANPDSRDSAHYPTILSGDIGTAGTKTDNSYHVVMGSRSDGTAILDGFTITAGNATGRDFPDCVGGGMYISSGSPTLRNCAFNANCAAYGGGMYNGSSSSPTLTNCEFSGNSVSISGQYGGYACGAGMYNAISSPTLTNCTFGGNSASANGQYAYAYGGGMYNGSSSPTLANCTFNADCATTSGGGMFNYDRSSPTLTTCTFTGNSAGGDGGGMHNEDYSSPTLTGCTFNSNSVSGGTYARGGGMFDLHGASPTLTNCIFSKNSASGNEYGVGGGMCNFSCSPTLTNCTFSGNSTTSGYYAYGGGMCNSSSSATVSKCAFNGNSASAGFWGSGGAVWNSAYSPTFTDCTFSGNSVSSNVYGYNAYGGGVSTEIGSSILTNCTFSGNSVGGTNGQGGGVYSSSPPTLTNCVLWGNTAANASQVYQPSGTSGVTYSDIQQASGVFPGAGNINSDPKFFRNPSPGADGKWGTADDDYGDLRLQLTSPCIDAGSNAAPGLSGITTDLAGNARFGDVPTVPDTGFGTAPIVDMGAYEVVLPKVAFATSGSTVLENAGSVALAIQLSAAFDYPVTVPLLLSGTAVQGTDYTIDSTAITIPAGATSASVNLHLIDDRIYEKDKTVVVAMGTPTNATFGAISSYTLTIPDGDPPALDPIGDKTVEEGTTLSLAATAVDPYAPASSLIYSLDGTPAAGASITAAGVFSWTPTEEQGPGTYAITVRVSKASDPSLFDTKTFGVKVNEVNRPPVLEAIADQTVAKHGTLSFTASAGDPDWPANGLTFSLDPGAPEGAGIDPRTGLFTWTTAPSQRYGVYMVTVRVRDDGTPAMSAVRTVAIRVTNPDGVMPPSKAGVIFSDASVDRGGGKSDRSDALGEVLKPVGKSVLR